MASVSYFLHSSDASWDFCFMKAIMMVIDLRPLVVQAIFFQVTLVEVHADL